MSKDTNRGYEAIRRLNKLYDEERIHYWCTATGDINVIGSAPLSCGQPEDMPPAIRRLYETLWKEGAGFSMYVVEIDGAPGMVFNMLLDDSYMQDIISKKELPAMPEDYINRMRTEGGKKAAELLLNTLSGASVYYGEQTDPDGDEVLVFIPDGDECETALNAAMKTAGEMFYDNFVRLFVQWYQDSYPVMGYDAFLQYLRENFDVSPDAFGLVESILRYAKRCPEYQQAHILSEILSGNFGLADWEIGKIKLDEEA